jgi:acetylornithine deacetylase
MQREMVAYARALEPAMKRCARGRLPVRDHLRDPSFLGSAADSVTRLASACRASSVRRWWLSAPRPASSRARNPDRGVRPGSISQAHQPDEYVSLEQLARCQAFLRGLAATQDIG